MYHQNHQNQGPNGGGRGRGGGGRGTGYGPGLSGQQIHYLNANYNHAAPARAPFPTGYNYSGPLQPPAQAHGAAGRSYIAPRYQQPSRGAVPAQYGQQPPLIKQEVGVPPIKREESPLHGFQPPGRPANVRPSPPAAERAHIPERGINYEACLSDEFRTDYATLRALMANCPPDSYVSQDMVVHIYRLLEDLQRKMEAAFDDPQHPNRGRSFFANPPSHVD